MIIISKNLSLVAPDQLGPNNPIIGYDNAVTISNVTASSEDASGAYPATNLANPATHLKWKAANSNAQTITIIPGTPEVECLAIARHNLGSIQASIGLKASSGAQDGFGNFIWDITLIDDLMIADDDPKMFRFTRSNYVALQLQIGASYFNEVPIIAVLFVCPLLTLERRIWAGHTPLPFGDVTTLVTSASENGQFLGRILISEMKATSVSMKNLTPDWYRQFWRPFQVAAKTQTFFFAWRPSDYPTEVGYAWIVGDPKMSNQQTVGGSPNLTPQQMGLVTLDFSIAGIGNLGA